MLYRNWKALSQFQPEPWYRHWAEDLAFAAFLGLIVVLFFTFALGWVRL